MSGEKEVGERVATSGVSYKIILHEYVDRSP
jgi:hypothetical protein